MLISETLNPCAQNYCRQQKGKLNNRTSTGTVPLERAPRHHFDSQRTALTTVFLASMLQHRVLCVSALFNDVCGASDYLASNVRIIAELLI
jgi:hypothetical protein